MAVGVADRTLQNVVKEVFRLCGWILNQGTSTAGSTTSLTDPNNERTPVANAASVSGTFLWMFGGDGAGQEREINAYSTLGVMPWTQAATSPGSNTTWIRVKLRPQAVLDAIDEVTRDAWVIQAIPLVGLSEALVTNNLLGGFGGDFELWTAGTTSAPDPTLVNALLYGWNAASNATIAQLISTSTPSPRHGRFAMSITDTSSGTGYLAFTVDRSYYHLLESASLFLRGWISQGAASTGRIRLVATNSSGTDTAKNWDADQTGNRWRKVDDLTDGSSSLSLPSTINNIELRVSAITTSGVVRVDDLMLFGPHIYDYPLPVDITHIDPMIYMETGYGTNDFSEELLYGKAWDIFPKDTTTSIERTLHFDVPLPSARHLRIRGYRSPDVQATASSNVEPNPVWLAHKAAVRLLEQYDPTNPRLPILDRKLHEMEASNVYNTTKGKGLVRIEPR